MRNKHLSQQVGMGDTQVSRGTNKSMPQALWTARIAAGYAGFQSPVTILRAFRRGELRGYRLGLRAVRFRPHDVKRWIDAARVEVKGGAQ